MSVTLEDLREAFIEAQRARLNLKPWGYPGPDTPRMVEQHIDDWAEGYLYQRHDALSDSDRRRCARAAILYVKARDEGLEAAMLYKLEMND